MRSCWQILFLGIFLLPVAAGAQATGQEQRCVNALNSSVRRVAQAKASQIYRCLIRGARGNLGEPIEACISSDDSRVANAQSQATVREERQCAGVLPPFGPVDAASGNQAAVAENLALARALFGPDLDASVVPLSSDREVASCQAAMLRQAHRCQTARIRAFNRCKKDGLRGRRAPAGAELPFVSAADLRLCLTEDAAGIVGRSCGGVVVERLDGQCVGRADLAETLPGCRSADPGIAGRCVDRSIECSVCRTLDAADRLGAACDACFAGELLALSYNVAGLPEGISGSMPATFTPLISPLLNGYDLVLVQESWQTPDPNPLAPLRVYHELLVADTRHPHQSVSQPLPVGNDPSRPSALVSDGLNRFSRFPFAPIVRMPWSTCFGLIDDGADCLALKGFSVARTTLAAGVVVDVYNLHAEAGNAPEDVAVRSQNVAELAAFLNVFSAGRAVIVGGDFNLNSDGEPAASQFQSLLSATGLSDVCATLGCPQPGRIDKFLFRSSSNVAITPTSWQFEVDVFQTAAGEPLSDHDALSVRFEWSAAP